jgi:intracellular sulfur oxidation DsrE/DsrF family protein
MHRVSRWVAGVVMLTTVEVIGAQSPSSDATVEGSRTRTAAAAQYRPVPGVTFAGRPALTYRLAWATSTGADSAHQVLDALFAPARVFNALRADGVAAGRIKLAIVARGPAIRAFLTDSAYRALKGIDNPNLPVLRELHARGVQLIICGQTMVGATRSRRLCW